jgi:hypothetical protein
MSAGDTCGTDHLRGHPERRADHGLVFKGLCDELIEAFRGPEVREFCHACVPQKHIRRLDVAVDHRLVACVQVVEPLQDLLRVFARQVLRQDPVLVDGCLQRPSRRELHEDLQRVLGARRSVVLHNVWVLARTREIQRHAGVSTSGIHYSGSGFFARGSRGRGSQDTEAMVS